MNKIILDDDTRNKLNFALKLLNNKDDYSYGIVSSDVYEAIDILSSFAKEVLDNEDKE
jgi:cephalosporin-C deacetylase-like acetyl esterase